MPYIMMILLFFSGATWAQELVLNKALQPIYDSPNVDMVYPDVAGEYLVYSQRVGKTYQVMRVHKNDLYGMTQDVSPASQNDTTRFGVALADGSVGYVSHRLGHMQPWLKQTDRDTAFAVGLFQNILLPNHLDADSAGKTWVFDSTFETTRHARIDQQFSNGLLHHELLGQAWRLYHSQLWAYKSSYAATKAGLTNRFRLPYIFAFERYANELAMLGDGFDASLSADGQYMVFVRENKGNFDIWMQNTDGSKLTRLTKNTFADLEPSLSADGKRIAFVSNRDAAGEVLQTSIYTLDIATGEVQRITTGKHVTDGGPAWLDNQTLIFHSNRDPKSPHEDTVDNWRLWTVSLP